MQPSRVADEFEATQASQPECLGGREATAQHLFASSLILCALFAVYFVSLRCAASLTVERFVRASGKDRPTLPLDVGRTLTYAPAGSISQPIWFFR